MKVTDRIEITNEDCMDLMARYEDNHFDLAIVDPPYGIGDFGDNDLQKSGKMWNNSIPDKEYFNEIYRVSKNQIIWGANYFQKHIKDVGRIIHNKLGKDPFRRAAPNNVSWADIASHSFGVTIKVFEYTWIGNVKGNDYQVDWFGKKIHPCEKPVKLYEWLLMNYAKEGDKILDTHLGSGSIAIACHNYKFDLTACELDKDYFDAAIQRIKNHTAQISIFD